MWGGETALHGALGTHHHIVLGARLDVQRVLVALAAVRADDGLDVLRVRVCVVLLGRGLHRVRAYLEPRDELLPHVLQHSTPSAVVGRLLVFAVQTPL